MDKFLIGIDEAGRGPLAGPVAVGAVCVPADYPLREVFPGLTDSKKLTAKRREQLFALLEEKAAAGEVRFAVEYSDALYIDTHGIVPAVTVALERALGQVALSPSGVLVLLDGSLKAPAAYAQQTIIKGDLTEAVISLASVAAKVLRDRVLDELEVQFPGYGLGKHKGYGTAAHYEALKKLGLSPAHRKSFIHLS